MENRETIYQKLKKSKKYKYLCDDTLYRIADWALVRFNDKQVMRAARNKLHQIYGAYMDNLNHNWLRKQVDKLPPEPPRSAVQKTARMIMDNHTSTAERMPMMTDVYRKIFEITGKPKKILDCACGLNPFSVTWMNLEPDAVYTGCDIDVKLLDIINSYFEKLGLPHKAECADLLVSAPKEEADVAFLFKTLPCLEQQEKDVGEKILATLNARYIVVSYPSRSLGGKEKGMEDHYHNVISQLIDRMGLHHTKLEFPNEMFYLLKKN